MFYMEKSFKTTQVLPEESNETIKEINCLSNKKVVSILEHQMSFDVMKKENIYERVYSSFDGRIYATLEENRVRLQAFSWKNHQEFDTIQEASKWLLKKALEQALFFKKFKKST